MTCREKLAKEYPDRISEDHAGGCKGCPDAYGYLEAPSCCGLEYYCISDEMCTKCWDREIPEKEEKHGLFSRIIHWFSSRCRLFGSVRESRR